MAESIVKTSERIAAENIQSRDEYLIYLRRLFAYQFAREKIDSESYVLDLGCGMGYGTNLISQGVKKIIGLDVDKDTISYASKKHGRPNCFFKLYDGEQIGYKDNTFDAVISFQVVEHIQDDLNYVSEVYRVLKENGIFILTTPNATHRLEPGQKPWNRFHKREYYPNTLNNILGTKFSEVEILGVSGKEEIQSLELERIKQGLKLISLDPLNLRRLIPASLKSKIIKILKKFVFKSENLDVEDQSFRQKYSLDDFSITKNNVENSLDLLVICKK